MLTKYVISFICLLGIIFGSFPSTNLTEKTQENSLEQVCETYKDLSIQVANDGESLNDIRYKINQVKEDRQRIDEQIEYTKGQLEKTKEALKKRVALEYKINKVSLVDLFLNAKDLDTLVNTLYYIDKINDEETLYIGEIQRMNQDLIAQKENLQKVLEELESLKNEQEQRRYNFKESFDDQQSFIEKLDEPTKQALEEQEQEQISEYKSEAIRALNKQQISSEGRIFNLPSQDSILEESSSNSKEEKKKESTQESKEKEQNVKEQDKQIQSQETREPIQETHESESIQETSESIQDAEDQSQNVEETFPIEETINDESESLSLSSDVRTKILEAAYSQLGVQYVYGASSPNEAFDCSGLTSWAYGQAGIDIPHSSAAQASMATNVSAEDLQPGDLVFYIGNASGSQSGNHVAIYAGDGQVIHANGSVVAVSDLNENYTSAGNIGF